MKTFRALASAAALLVTSLVPAHAAIMTFDDITGPRPDPHIWVEDGITAHAREFDVGFVFESWIYPWDVPGTAHMTDQTYNWPDTITFTMSHLFSAVSFDIVSTYNLFWPDNYWEDDGPNCSNPHTPSSSGVHCGIPFKNVEVTGMRDGSIIAQDIFYMGTEPWTYLFASEFSKLDTLIIALLMPSSDLLLDPDLAGICVDAPCTHMSIDNVTLSPVPLPAPLLLFLTGLGALALLGRRKSGARAR